MFQTTNQNSTLRCKGGLEATNLVTRTNKKITTWSNNSGDVIPKPARSIILLYIKSKRLHQDRCAWSVKRAALLVCFSFFLTRPSFCCKIKATPQKMNANSWCLFPRLVWRTGVPCPAKARRRRGKTKTNAAGVPPSPDVSPRDGMVEAQLIHNFWGSEISWAKWMKLG